VERMQGERLPIAALHGHVDGKRSRGRQRKVWMDNAREDLKEKNIEDAKNSRWSHGLAMRPEE